MLNHKTQFKRVKEIVESYERITETDRFDLQTRLNIMLVKAQLLHPMILELISDIRREILDIEYKRHEEERKANEMG